MEKEETTSKQKQTLKKLMLKSNLISYDMGIGRIDFFQPENLTLLMKLEQWLTLQGGKKIYE